MMLGLVPLFSFPAVAGSGGLSEFPSHVLPVLVQVDDQGKITGISPSERLSPRVDKLLRANLREMVRGPAIDNEGRSTASLQVLNLGLVKSARPDGSFDVSFAYVSATPVPAGSWYWVHTDGRQLALARQGSGNRRERDYHYRDWQSPRFGPSGMSSPPAGGPAVSPAVAVPMGSTAILGHSPRASGD
ncbi:hypothetical protein [Thermomonas sp.]|uniref:hypothetical protein n=1 Tax=Thermomonas sp. TaxID=1971895 RepID=UPI0035B2C47C